MTSNSGQARPPEKRPRPDFFPFIDLIRNPSYHAEMEHLRIFGLALGLLLSSCSRNQQSEPATAETTNPASLWLAYDTALENAKQAGCAFNEGPFIVKPFSTSAIADTKPPVQASLDCSHAGVLRQKIAGLKEFQLAADALKGGTTLTAQELALLETRQKITKDLLNRAEPYLVFEPLEALMAKAFLALEPLGMVKRVRTIDEWELDAFPEVPLNLIQKPDQLFQVIKIFTEFCDEGRKVRTANASATLPMNYAYNLQYACGISEGGWHGVHHVKYMVRIKSLEDLGVQLQYIFGNDGTFMIYPMVTPKYTSGVPTDEKIVALFSEMDAIAGDFFSRELAQDVHQNIVGIYNALDNVHSEIIPILNFLKEFNPKMESLKDKLAHYTLDQAHEMIGKEEKALTWLTIKKDEEGKLTLEKISLPAKLDLANHDLLRGHLNNLMNLHSLYHIWLVSMRTLKGDFALPDNQDRVQREVLVKELGIRIQKALRIEGTVFEDTTKDRVAPDFQLPATPEPVLPKPN